MKKVFSVLLIAVFLFSSAAVLTACADTESAETPPAKESADIEGSTPASEAPEETLIGLTFNMLTDEFCKGIADGVTARYDEVGVKVIQADANNNVNTMIEQMENFSTMKVVQIIAMPINSDGIEDICTRLMSDGMQIVFIGLVPEKYEISGAVNTDHAAVGATVGRLAIAWLDQVYPNADDGSVHTACLMAVDIAEVKIGSEAMRDTIAADPRVTITFTSDGIITIDEAADSARNAFMVDENIKLFMCYTSDMAVGVNNVITGLPDTDISEYAIFCSNMSETAIQLIEQSKTNDDSALRGLVGYGGGAPSDALFECSYDVFTGAAELPNYCWDTIFSINSIGFEV